VNERISELQQSNEPNAGKWVGSLVSFKSRMHWRDHFMQRLESEPVMEFQPLNRAYEKLDYANNPEQTEAFFAGKTGYPMIDAVMRCLHQTRFVNFRMRAMITSFACHTLQIDWRLVNKPLAQFFLDYEPGIHLSQLQMQAGVVGINTLRTYNPTKQLIDQDPACVFVKKWVPELRNFTPAEIIDHVTFPLADYVRPIVEWRTASAEMRKKISEIRKSFFTKEISQTVFQKHGSRKKNTMGKRKAKPKAVNPNAPSLFD
jgi:deoxyribodipyrimidine photo-lyase